MSFKLIFIFVISLIACSIETDISAPSLPDVAAYFNISEGLTQMTIAINFVGLCVSCAVYGPLSDAFGRRTVMIYGNAIMMLGAALCMVAWSIESLIFARFIQGIGAGASVVIVFAMIADLCSGPEASKMIARLNSLLTIMMSVAPLLGSFVNQAFEWRGGYGFVFIISFFAWLLLYLYLPETKQDKEPLRLIKVASDYKRLLTSYNIFITAAPPSLMSATYITFVSAAPFIYMETYKVSINEYGILQGIIIIAYSVVSIFTDKLTALFGERRSFLIGIFLLLTGGGIFTLLSYLDLDGPYVVTIVIIYASAGAAIAYPILFVKSFDFFPDIKGSTSSILMSSRTLVMAGFIAFSGYIYDGSALKVAAVIFFGNIFTALLSFFALKRVDLS